MPKGFPASANRITIDVVEAGGDWSAVGDIEDRIACAIDAVARHPGLVGKPIALAVALSTDAEIAKLNGQFRGKPQATNVLSFPSGTRAAAGGFIGDIILAAETVAREACEQAVPFDHHVMHLVVHGVLHLLGYDHEAAADAERMEALEIEILGKLGIANPYTAELA